MIADLLATARDVGRLREISGVLMRFGFVDVVHRLGLSSALEKLGEKLQWTEAENLATMRTPERIRAAMEALGPTFVKLGQLLSTRVDLFAPDWIEEFEHLQDEVPAVEFAAVRAQIEADLGQAPETAFASFDSKPLAAGSIAQVYSATLHEGDSVVVKVRRPEIAHVVEADLRLLARLAALLQEHLPETRRYRFVELVGQFARSIRLELDFVVEARNAERIAANLAEHYGKEPCPLVIPKTYPKLNCPSLNVQERITGIPGRDVDALPAAGLDARLIARNGARAILTTIVEDGFFHADPHPGNLFYLSDHRIGLIDFGMVGFLSERRREQFVSLLHAIVENDEEGVADMLLDLSKHTSNDRDALVSDVSIFLRNYHGVELEQLEVSRVLRDLLVLLRSHELTLPPELALTFKVFITLEGLGRRLDPDFNLVEESAPVIKRAFASFYSPVAMTRRAQASAIDAVKLLSRLPRDLRNTLVALSEGSLQLRIDVSELNEISARIDKAASRLTIGLITAALIVGSAIAMTVGTGPQLFGLPMFGAVGFVGAAVGGTWVIVSIMRGK